MRDALQKRHDTVMQYVCVKRPTSGFVPSFSFWTRSTDAPKDAVFSYLAVSVYISLSRSHTNTSKKRGGGSLEKKCRVKIHLYVTAVRGLHLIVRKRDGQGDGTLHDRAVANPLEKKRLAWTRTKEYYLELREYVCTWILISTRFFWFFSVR